MTKATDRIASGECGVLWLRPFSGPAQSATRFSTSPTRVPRPFASRTQPEQSECQEECRAERHQDRCDNSAMG